MEQSANVLMERDGQRTEVANNKSVQIMEGLGWNVVKDESAPADTSGGSAPQTPAAPEDMTAAELKAELTAAGVVFKGNASKADLAALVTAARTNGASA